MPELPQTAVMALFCNSREYSPLTKWIKYIWLNKCLFGLNTSHWSVYPHGSTASNNSMRSATHMLLKTHCVQTSVWLWTESLWEQWNICSSLGAGLRTSLWVFADDATQTWFYRYDVEKHNGFLIFSGLCCQFRNPEWYAGFKSAQLLADYITWILRNIKEV